MAVKRSCFSSVKKTVDSRLFQAIVLALIIFYSLLVGVELYYPGEAALEILDWVIIWFFVAEILLKIIVACPAHKFFSNSWNVFDFVIVFSAFIPSAGTTVVAIRVLRVFRTLRLVTFSKDLRLIVGTLLKSMTSIFHIGLLLGIIFYIYAIIGTAFFAAAAPQHFGTLHTSVLTLFRVATLENWSAIMEQSTVGNPLGKLYFISFIIIGTYIILNLFIAIIVNNLESVRKQQDREKKRGKR